MSDKWTSVLTDGTVSLVRVSEDDAEALFSASREMSHRRYTPLPGDTLADTLDYIVQRCLTNPKVYAAYTIRVVADDRPIGCIRVDNVRTFSDGQVYAAEIGGLWLAADTQHRGIARSACLVLINHVFTTWPTLQRVDARTDDRNQSSKNLLTACGFEHEGTMRRCEPSFAPGEANRLRDTSLFGLIAESWLATKSM